MKPTTEIIESLRRCSSTYCVGTCENCHYFKVPNCASELRLDAANALEAQQKEIEELKQPKTITAKEAEVPEEPITFKELREIDKDAGELAKRISSVFWNQQKEIADLKRQLENRQETEIDRNEVLETLAKWIKHVTDSEEMAPKEAVEALPRVAEVYLNYSSSQLFASPPVIKNV